MEIQAVTFDCAETLLRVNSNPYEVIALAARRLGFRTPQASLDLCHELLRADWDEYLRVNRSRDAVAAKRWWREFASEWVGALGLPCNVAGELHELSTRLLLDPRDGVFELYPDVFPALQELARLGLRMAVISNWDLTLHAILESFGLTRFFEFELASLEEGFEKPDPSLFRIAATRFELPSSAILHVGDDPICDAQGARQAGMRSLLIDRKRPVDSPFVIQSFSQIEARLRR